MVMPPYVYCHSGSIRCCSHCIP